MIEMAAAASDVEVKLVSLAVTEMELTRLRSLLTADELQRGNRLVDEGRRNRFLAGRGLLREALGRHLGEAPERIVFAEGEFGKPHLRDHSGRDALRFNVSHAGGYLLMAFAAGREIGVDLEQVRDDLPFYSMANRYFSPREQEDLFILRGDEVVEGFFRCWTRKEAYMKATGTGFSQPSTGFDVSLLPGRPAALLAHGARPGEPMRWRIEDLEVPEGYCAAFSVENL